MAPSSLESSGRDMMTVMKTAAFGFKRAYRLTPDRGPADDVVSLVRINSAASSKTVLLPYSVGLGYVVVPTGATTSQLQAKTFAPKGSDCCPPSGRGCAWGCCSKRRNS